MALSYNYHTHTPRCNHALGTEREYVEKAIEAGIKTLGFSDHAPYLFPNGYSSPHRMLPSELFDYAKSILALKKEYEKDIRILCGFELEYYPKYHEKEMQFLKQVNPDFILMGQHFTNNEIDGVYAYNNTEFSLESYVDQTLEGLATGDFLYLAHPDLVGAAFPKALALKEQRRLCEGAKKMGIPLEINLLGICTNRAYPSRAFFEIAADVGNDIVLGTDAHSPDAILDHLSQEKAMQMVKDLGLRLITEPIL